MQIKITKSFSNYLILTIIFLFSSIAASIFNVSSLYLDIELIGTFPNRVAYYYLVQSRWTSVIGLTLNGLAYGFAYKCYELLKQGKAFEISNDSNLLQR